MSSVALYRKYRPQVFDAVLGQDHVVRVLQKAIESDSISHAYLFAGSRGTGKTSVARIFARGIGTDDSDLYEIDAASNRGIDDIREIRDAVSTLPFSSKYKVYIVDEVHMLTKEAFNALLKTLEEPPAHVVFILATTELEKLPDTIVSRCETYVFKKPSQELLKSMIIDVAKKEKLTLDAPSADLIALLGDGSFRDTQGILQKVLGIAEGKKISLAEIEAITGAPKSKLVLDFVEAVSKKNVPKALGALHEAGEGNVEMKLYLKLILQKLRFILLLRFAPEMTEWVKGEVREEDFKMLETLAQDSESAVSAKVLSEFLSAGDKLKYAFIPELPLELALLSLFGEYVRVEKKKE